MREIKLPNMETVAQAKANEEAEEEKEYLQGYINGLIDSRQFVSKKEGSK